ncbi:hypothetical protein C7A12_00170 [Pseudomonas fluorescens]|uniref:Uncharacterized protein n=1 Tax=Pseudomonas fluorescens TaxID=294 RepID=A0A2T0IHV7_PSEFL|nr:hypothetical protein C7A12_00170 [Pseudomonas fluorescens]PRW82787.1 hypothetical protein C7A13_00170 [Pseudomonas fluorescens]PRW94900.1 hypothetical protein C7A10_04140 [Pseudomonas fluorescens]
MTLLNNYSFVGASSLAKNVNDNAALQVASGACGCFASKLAPTGNAGFRRPSAECDDCPWKYTRS